MFYKIFYKIRFINDYVHSFRFFKLHCLLYGSCCKSLEFTVASFCNHEIFVKVEFTNTSSAGRTTRQITKYFDLSTFN